jgi:predicted DNA binding CopG/RHH family protein
MNLPKLPKRPKFKDEDEEAEWWYKNRKIVERRLSVEAAKNSKAISIRLPVNDLELAKQLAEHMGIGYQTLIRTLLHEGLKRHDQKTTRR